MKSRCELCAATLDYGAEAYICSFECTYCPACKAKLAECPNCAGELLLRPRRTSGLRTVAARTPARVARRVRRSRK